MKLFTITETCTCGISAQDLDGIATIGGSFGQKLASQLPDVRMNSGDLVVNSKANPRLHIGPEKFARSRQALVLIKTEPGEGGEIWLTANSVKEELINGRVMRTALPLSKAVGVTLLGSTDTRVLLLLEPGSQVRLCRSGYLNKHPPEFVINWTGRHIPENPAEAMRVHPRTFRIGGKSRAA